MATHSTSDSAVAAFSRMRGRRRTGGIIPPPAPPPPPPPPPPLSSVFPPGPRGPFPPSPRSGPRRFGFPARGILPPDGPDAGPHFDVLPRIKAMNDPENPSPAPAPEWITADQ